MGSDKIVVSRRDLLGMAELAAIGVMIAAVGGSIRRAEGEFYFSRPPGARDEAVFLSLCIRCDKCRDACPYHIIRPVRITESLINVGTPVLEGHCRNCRNVCIPHCPTGALV